MEKLQEKLNYLKNYDGPPLRLMEVCGTHTAGIFKSGIRSVISPRIRLISGPGCPVCVTPTAYIDKCVEYALTPGFALVSFGDMLKVPGSREFSPRGGLGAGGGAAGDARASAAQAVSLERAKGFGAHVELVYSPFDAIKMAEREPGTVFVIAAVGFETTAPAYALFMDEIIARSIKNIRLLTALKSATNAIEWCIRTESSGGVLPPSDGLLRNPAPPEGEDLEGLPYTGRCIRAESSEGVLSAGGGESYAIDGFLCPGHVSVITGSHVYEPLARKYGKPFVVAGFEEAHLVHAIYELARLAAAGSGQVSNRYGEAVSEEGNAKARDIVDKYFERGPAVWRGLGEISGSGLYLRPGYIEYDAGSRSLTDDAALPKGCQCADVITGRIDPQACPMFGKSCTPENAQGPCMVSAEGACGIWYTFGSVDKGDVPR
ncbi:MAG: hydrogenase formation protein HypD [Clostridiales Family XIII bacterium]|jgi:hydrogenase expression/formation protein HypD|nr:hydrogenase formation protein HypD [Clostridiales Family XIII bacterium]